MNYELEQMFEIWDERGGVIEVGPDRDGLGLLEIRVRDDGSKITTRITLEKPQARLLVTALRNLGAIEVDPK